MLKTRDERGGGLPKGGGVGWLGVFGGGDRVPQGCGHPSRVRGTGRRLGSPGRVLGAPLPQRGPGPLCSAPLCVTLLCVALYIFKRLKIYC